MKLSFYTFLATLSLCRIGYPQKSMLSNSTAEDYFETSLEISKEFPHFTKAEDGNCTANIAQRGIFWESGEVPEYEFLANKFRDSILNILQYSITQKSLGYHPISISFGDFCSNDSIKPFTIDLSNNALLQLTIENPSWDNYSVDIFFKLIDINGNILQYDKEILKDPSKWLNYSIGFTQSHLENSSKMPLNLNPGDIKTLIYDFKNAIGSKSFPPNTQENLFPDNSNFNFSKVKAISFLVVNSEMDETGQPYDIFEKVLYMKSFKLGINPVITQINEQPIPNPTFSNQNIQIFDITGNLVFNGTNEELFVISPLKHGLYILKTEHESRKIYIK